MALSLCVCVLAIKAQPETFVNRSGPRAVNADPTNSKRAQLCSRSQCSPPAVAPKSRSPAQMMFISQSIVFAVCLVAESETLRESLSGLLGVSCGSKLRLRVLSVDLLLLLKVPPTWLVTEMRQMTNDLKFIIAARSLCSQHKTERNA